MSDDHDSNHGGRGNAASNEEELASKTLQIQSKRFYIDVKQNKRGRFIKIAEVDAGGRKSRLLLAMSTAAEFRDQLTNFSEHYASLGPASSGESSSAVSEGGGKLKSEMIVKDDRRYYLDLKENQRGRFLRVSMTLSLSRQRFQIAIPAQGMIEVRDALTDLLKEFGTEDFDSKEDLPEAKSLRVENKIFYFDVGVNKRGKFMRVSEVRSNYRTAITIPEQSWGRFRDVINDFVKELESGKGESAATVGGGEAGDSTSSPNSKK